MFLFTKHRQLYKCITHKIANGFISGGIAKTYVLNKFFSKFTDMEITEENTYYRQ